MKIHILYFATFRDLTGLREEDISLSNNATVVDLKDQLIIHHPPVEDALPTAVIAINREFAFDEDELRDGDEVAIFPPVSGGRDDFHIHIEIVDRAFDHNAILADLIRPTTGAACFFTGIVRAKTTGAEGHETAYLEYEAYRPMAEEKLRQIASEIRDRWPSIEGVAIVQRIGHIDPGTPSVLVACTAAHRDTGVFEAARFGIDRLKEIVPIWKKEVSPDGEYWVEGEYIPDANDLNS
jgi:molybdopterin converting factor subunit 1